MGIDSYVSNLSIRVHVSTRAAILSGHTRTGMQALVLTDDMLTPLSEAERLELALVVDGGPDLGTLVTDPPITEPTINAVTPVLRARAAMREAVTTSQRIKDAETAEALVARTRAVAAQDATRTKALRLWVETHGDDEQKARMRDGYLRDEEILDDVCADLLDLAEFTRYEPLRRGDACDCACAGSVYFEVKAPGYMDEFTYRRLTALTESVPDGAKVTPTEHRAACPACKCVPIARISAKVTMPWNGWLLVREYLLV